MKKYDRVKVSLSKWTVLCLLLVGFLGFFIGSKLNQTSDSVHMDGQTVKIKLENIGELATQSAYCTEVQVNDDAKKLLGMNLPFTEAKQIYSYTVNIKAGYDFGEITYSVDEDNKKIVVQLPEVKILSKELDPDSFKIYHEQESIFTSIDLGSQNEAMKELLERAETDAVANGLYEEAEKNAELVLKGFFAGNYDLDTYTLQFEKD